MAVQHAECGASAATHLHQQANSNGEVHDATAEVEVHVAQLIGSPHGALMIPEACSSDDMHAGCKGTWRPAPFEGC